jgi:hypothetical protein
MSPADDLTVFIPRLPKQSPRPAPVVPRSVALAALTAVWTAFGALATGLVWLMVLILTS